LAEPGKRITLLIVDDDEDDRELSADALAQSPLVMDLRFLEDGEELMAYLERHGGFGEASESPRPDLVLLDLRMPRKSGWEALAEIKANPRLRTIPVVILSTSKAQLDIQRCYELGATISTTSSRGSWATTAGCSSACRSLIRAVSTRSRSNRPDSLPRA
jgi:two-component system, response regulator